MIKTFSKLKAYTQFLYENHLDNLARENLKLARDMDLPLLKMLQHLSEDEQLALAKKGFQDFLISFKEDKAIEVAFASIDNWKNNAIPGIVRDEVTPTDIVFAYNNRKQVLFNSLSSYTSDFEVAIQVVKELETFYSTVEKYAIETYVQIQKEGWEEVSLKMKYAHEALEDSNEKLQESKEELQALNEELASTNEELHSANEELATANEELAAANEELLTANEEQTKYIYEIEKIKQELEQSRDYYLTLLDDFPSLIWRADPEAKCDYFNKTWLNFTGRDFEQEAGDGWAENVHASDLERCFNIFTSNFNARKPFVREYRMRRHDGEYRWIIDYGKPIYHMNGEFAGFLGTCFDVTEQKDIGTALRVSNEQLQIKNDELNKTEKLLKESYSKLEERVKLRTKDLQNAKDKIEALLERERAAKEQVTAQKMQLNEMNRELVEKNDELVKINIDLDNFIYTASHDLKAPITNLEGLMNLLNLELNNKAVSKEKKILEMMATSIRKFKKTILDLTEITKVQKGLNGKAEPLAFKDVLEDVRNDLDALIKESSASISEDFQVKSISFSPNNMRSIFYNLISNAIKYRSLQRPLLIEIKSFRENGYVVLSVADNGLGVREANKPKLFKMFKRFHTHVEGTGIGLYVIKRIVENNKGKIELESEEGIGTNFKIYISEN